MSTLGRICPAGSDGRGEQVADDLALGLEPSPDWREAASVGGAGAEPAQGIQVLRNAIALVPGEAVTRVLGIEGTHVPVAADLGEDRGGTDRRLGGVAADHGAGL